jgi:hypothetical protein
MQARAELKQMAAVGCHTGVEPAAARIQPVDPGLREFEVQQVAAGRVYAVRVGLASAVHDYVALADIEGAVQALLRIGATKHERDVRPLMRVPRDPLIRGVKALNDVQPRDVTPSHLRAGNLPESARIDADGARSLECRAVSRARQAHVSPTRRYRSSSPLELASTCHLDQFHCNM